MSIRGVVRLLPMSNKFRRILKAEYLKALDRIHDSREYEADEKLLTQINNRYSL